MPEWLTTEDAAEILGYHVEYVRRLARHGNLKAKKFGPTWMVDGGAIRRLTLPRRSASG